MELDFKKVLLVILDGFGIASEASGNAISRAGMPTFDNLVNNYPVLALQAAGPNVGLPWGEPGNSEVGHMCLGAGRIVPQDLPRIDKAITTGEFYKNPNFLAAIEHVKKNNSSLHIMGLLGDGRVHASQLHLNSLLSLAAEKGLSSVFVHCITDGRDSDPQAGRSYILNLEKKFFELGVGKIASIVGRFYAMDRANHWDLTEMAYKAYVAGEGDFSESAIAAIENYYEQSIYDEVIPPTLIAPSKDKMNLIKANDALILFNFRADRMTQITRAFAKTEEAGFSHKYSPLNNLFVVTMTDYSRELSVHAAFPKLQFPNCLTEVLSKNRKKQYHVSEEEKFAHITYFFNLGVESSYAEEQWEVVRSNSQYKDRYQNVPQMAAYELTQKICEKLKEPYDFYVVNYANPDMVGHTGNLGASIKAVQTIDACLEKLVKQVLESADTLLIVTSDHGNIEGVHQIHTGRINTSHSTNPVPFVMVGGGLELKKIRKEGYTYLAKLVPEGLLSDVAPTILNLFEIEKPAEMTGISLLPKLSNQVLEEPDKQHFEVGG